MTVLYVILTLQLPLWYMYPKHVAPLSTNFSNTFQLYMNSLVLISFAKN